MLGLDIVQLVTIAGYTGIGAIVFAESGLLIGFFLPGDSLLFTAGFLASQGLFNIRLLAALCFITAVAGDSVGYAFGFRLGRRLFNRPNSLLFRRDHLLRAEQFYRQHGGKTIILARFMPVIRTFAPIVAGVGAMPYGKFLLYNLLGGLGWAGGLTTLGYFLGSTIPNIDQYLIPIILGIIIVSIAPTLLQVLRNPEMRSQLRASLDRAWQRLNGKE